MASGSVPVERITHDIPALKSRVYDESIRLTEEDPRVVFHQNDILDMDFMDGVPPESLLDIINALLSEKLYKVVQDAQGMGWKARSREEAKRYSTLTPEQEMVYSHIDESGDEGIWIRTIKMRSKLHDSVVSLALKQLESKSLVKTVKSVEHPTRKMYIKSNIRASEKTTGGAFFSLGELDEEFVAMMCTVLRKYICQRSFYKSSTMMRNANKIVSKNPEEVKAARDKGMASKAKNIESMIPMPHGYAGYPGLNEMTAFIMETGLTNDKVTLTAPDVQQLLNLLIFDDKIEKVEGGKETISYRALRNALYDDPDEEMREKSVLTEMPCGRCPVFELCEEGGPVSPSSCVYFHDWLEI